MYLKVHMKRILCMKHVWKLQRSPFSIWFNPDWIYAETSLSLTASLQHQVWRMKSPRLGGCINRDCCTSTWTTSLQSTGWLSSFWSPSGVLFKSPTKRICWFSTPYLAPQIASRFILLGWSLKKKTSIGLWALHNVNGYLLSSQLLRGHPKMIATPTASFGADIKLSWIAT